MKPTANPDDEQRRLSDKLNLETATVPWTELQSFFARGVVIRVIPSMDLFLVAEQLAADNAPVVEQWMSEGRVAKVSDSEAAQWLEQDTHLWTVVIKPWVLVQDK